jgi:antitoxin HigA-1
MAGRVSVERWQCRQRKSGGLPLGENMRPNNPIHPGEMLLEEFLVPTEKSQTAFSAELGWTPAKLNELIKGKRGITADSALDLAEALGTSPEIWMNLQVMWDLRQAEKKRKAG